MTLMSENMLHSMSESVKTILN